MAHVIFKLPHPSAEGVFSLEEQNGRTALLVCEWEELELEVLAIVVDSLQAFRCTYEEACPLEYANRALDQLVDIGPSAWLESVKQEVEDGDQLKHLMIYLEDIGCYEFICKGFHTERVQQGSGIEISEN